MIIFVIKILLNYPLFVKCEISIWKLCWSLVWPRRLLIRRHPCKELIEVVSLSFELFSLRLGIRVWLYIYHRYKRFLWYTWGFVIICLDIERLKSRSLSYRILIRILSSWYIYFEPLALLGNLGWHWNESRRAMS